MQWLINDMSQLVYGMKLPTGTKHLEENLLKKKITIGEYTVSVAVRLLLGKTKTHDYSVEGGYNIRASTKQTKLFYSSKSDQLVRSAAMIFWMWGAAGVVEDGEKALPLNMYLEML